MMSRLVGFYIARVMENVAAGTAAITPRQAGVHAVLDATDTHGRGPSTLDGVAAAVHRFIGNLDTASRGRRTLGHLRLPPPEPARQPSER
jgi:hypothetical protein